MRRHLVLAVLAGSALACGGSSATPPPDLVQDSATDGIGGDGLVFDSDPGEGLPPLGIYTITPTNAVLKNDTATGTKATQAFKAFKNEGGPDVDVTASTTFSLDDATIGTFAANVFTCNDLPTGVLGKSTQVRGLPGNALANVTCIALRTTGDKRDFFFLVPYLKDPDPPKDILKFGTSIKQVDVAFVQDTTASMGPEIKNLGDSLSTIITNLKAAIPSVGIAIGRHDDFPVTPFGYDGSAGGASDVPFQLLQAVTTNESLAKSAVVLLSAYRGGALPESQYEAQYQVLTGDGLTWTVAKAGSIAKHTPPAGTSGGADFRAGSLPVVAEITDASWNEKDRYASGALGGAGFTAHGKDDVVKAYADLKAKFVGIHAVIEKTLGAGLDTPCDCLALGGCDPTRAACDSARGYGQAYALAQATGSVVDPSVFGATCAAGKCCTGVAGAALAPDGTGKCPLAYQARGCVVGSTDPTCGKGVADSVVKAIEAISVGSSFDVTAVPSNDPSNPPDTKGVTVDATKFIKSIRAMEEGDATVGCPSHAAKDTNADGVKDTFISVIVGTPVCFEVNAKMNDFVEPLVGIPQFFNAFIDVVGMPGSVKLDRRSVLFLVPPKDPPRAK
jgi:hypothetical protein